MEKLSIGVAATLLCLTSSLALAAPEDCASNFSVEGNFFKGKVYKTSAELPAVKPEAAFRKAYLFTSANDNFVRVRMSYIFHTYATKNSLAQWLDDFSTFH